MQSPDSETRVKMIWDCMTAKVVGEMMLIDDTINVCDYSKIMTDKMTPSLQKLKESQHENNPKHKITQEYLMKKRLKL